MDGRAALGLSLCLLLAEAGCQTQELNGPAPGSASSAGKPTPPIDPSQIKKAAPKFKNLPAPILVSYGNFEAGEAFSPLTDADHRQQLCESARTNYEKALKTDPKYIPAYQGLAQLYTSLHEYPLAAETYQKALKRAPNNSALWFGLGLCHNYQKNMGPAVECLERAVRIEPTNRSYANALGVVLAESGRYQDSLKSFVRSNGEAMGCYRLAQTLHHLQQPELSRRYLEAAVQKDPSLMALTMQNESPPAATPAPPIQQTAYQTAAYAEPAAPPPPPAPVVAPQPSPPQAVLPPPPPVSGE